MTWCIVMLGALKKLTGSPACDVKVNTQQIACMCVRVGEIVSEREGERESARVCVCMYTCVCVCVYERERVRVCVLLKRIIHHVVHYTTLRA